MQNLTFESKFDAVCAELCNYCKHRWGEHAIVGCQHKDCRGKREGCKYNGIKAIRVMMANEDFKFILATKVKPKIEVQTTL